MAPFAAATEIAICLAVLLTSATAGAEIPPAVRAEWIDSEGQVSQTSWRSTATWIWSQNRLALQTIIEIPKHIAASLPAFLKSRLHGADLNAGMTLQDDHSFLVLELKTPVALFKLDNRGRQSLRVTVDHDHTNWMRNANCRGSNPSLIERENFDADVDRENGNPDALFLSLYCKQQLNGTWVEVANSDEVSLRFEPVQQTRFQRTETGTAFWVPASEKTLALKLATITVLGANGEPTQEYELQASPIPRALSIAPVQWDPSFELREAAPPVLKAEAPLIGLQAQFMAPSGSRQSGRTGLASAELALSARVEKELGSINRFADLDLEIPIRRLGAGLDAKGAATHLTWLNAGYEIKDGGPLAWTFGAQASLLDVRSPDRTTILSISPSVQAHFGNFYSATLAPFDLNSGLGLLRGRADWPITPDYRNRLTLEAVIGRTWFQPRANSWDVEGLTLGFVGAF